MKPSGDYLNFQHINNTILFLQYCFLLGLHLEGLHLIFHEDSAQDTLRQSPPNFDALNSEEDINILYEDIPKPYNYGKKWTRRSENSHWGKKCIGRISSVSPINVELYHLKLLLLKVCGKDATSFKQLNALMGLNILRLGMLPG